MCKRPRICCDCGTAKLAPQARRCDNCWGAYRREYQRLRSQGVASEIRCKAKVTIDHPAIAKRIRHDGECWTWTGTIIRRTKSPAPSCFIRGRNIIVRRVLYANENPSTPLDTRRLVVVNCGNPLCVRPQHMVVLTAKDMCHLGMAGATSRNASKTRCSKCGGEYTVRIERGMTRRYCVPCIRARVRNRKQTHPEVVKRYNERRYRLYRERIKSDPAFAEREKKRSTRRTRRYRAKRDATARKRAAREQRRIEAAAKAAAIAQRRAERLARDRGDDLPELDEATLEREKAAALAETLARMKTEQTKTTPPPTDRKEAIRRKLLEEIEQMARSRCDA